MKATIIRPVIIVLLLGLASSANAREGVLSRRLPVGYITAGMCRIVISPTAAPLQVANGAEKPQPMTQQQVMELVAAHLTNQRIEELVKSRGIDFMMDDDYARSLRKAGANEQLITLLREAGKKTADVALGTEPNAQVFLDGNLMGQADAKGELEFRALVGNHTLKVSLVGKQDFAQPITLAQGPPIRVVAPLADLAGSLRVKAPSGAAVWLDGATAGTVDSSGELLLNGILQGTHSLRVTASGKVDDSRSVTVAAGVETPVEAALADAVVANPQDGLNYVWIASGNFLMGCSPGDNDCAEAEKPAHSVTLQKAYWIGQTEVTVGAYKRFVAATKVKLPPVAPKINRGWKIDGLPIVNVTWDESSQYCTWAGGRLPTEAEWENAARAGIPQARYGNLADIAWTKENAANQTHAVAGRQASAFGLFDMLGNVWEWVNDWYDPNYYQTSPAQDPTGPATGLQRVLRGGSWIVDAKLLRASDRYSIEPAVRSEFFGFRCVWEPKAP